MQVMGSLHHPSYQVLTNINIEVFPEKYHQNKITRQEGIKGLHKESDPNPGVTHIAGISTSKCD